MLAGWLLLLCEVHMLPWWCLVAWACNAAAIHDGRGSATPNPWELPPPGGFAVTGDASPLDALTAMQTRLLPLLLHARATATLLERLLNAPRLRDVWLAMLVLPVCWRCWCC